MALQELGLPLSSGNFHTLKEDLLRLCLTTVAGTKLRKNVTRFQLGIKGPNPCYTQPRALFPLKFYSNLISLGLLQRLQLSGEE